MAEKANVASVDWTALHARIAQAAAASAKLLAPDEDEGRRLMDERARKLAAPRIATAATEHIELAYFAIGEERFAIETRFVAQVAPMAEPERLPWVTPVFRGVVNHHGEVLAVVDLPALLTGMAAPQALCFLLVLGDPQPELGIAIEAAEEVTRVPLAEIRTDGIPETLRASSFVRGMYQASRVVLDGAELLRDPRLFVSEEA